jgi:hypothetical protein
LIATTGSVATAQWQSASLGLSEIKALIGWGSTDYLSVKRLKRSRLSTHPIIREAMRTLGHLQLNNCGLPFLFSLSAESRWLW